MSNDKEIVMIDSPEAAKYRTDINGWVSRDGMYCGDDESSERVARYAGATHRRCECGEITEKMWIECAGCRAKATRERWLKLPSRVWDGSEPVTEFDGDRYWFDLQSFLDECESDETDPQSVMLTFCKPIHAPELDADDYFHDVLPEDDGVPDALADAVDAFNAAVKAYGVLSWTQGNERAEMPRTLAQARWSK